MHCAYCTPHSGVWCSIVDTSHVYSTHWQTVSSLKADRYHGIETKQALDEMVPNTRKMFNL